MTDLCLVDDKEALAKAGAEIFFRKLESALRSRGIFSVVFSGGATPKAMFKRIAHGAPQGIDWGKVHFFWADERDVPAEDAESNFGLARKTLLKSIPVPERNLHRFRTELRSPERVARDYEEDLRAFFVDVGQPRFDLVYLGLGRDGHTASLFAKARPSAFELAAEERWVEVVREPGGNTGGCRYTLTPKAINAAAEVVFLVSGAEKSHILREVLDLKASSYPARLIAPSNGKLLWLADREAASRLENIELDRPPVAVGRIANQLRIHSIRATTAAGSGHPTSCCSAAELVATLFFARMRFDPEDPHYPNNDRFVLSKGHAAPLLYAAWAEAGHTDPSALESLRRLDSPFEGHPTPKLDFVDVATGSLGQGLSAGVGMAINARIGQLSYQTYVLLGDGELAEGSIWEAVELASFRKLSNLCAILDVNRLGQSQPTALGHDVETYRARFEAFGWRTRIIDGHDVEQILEALESAGHGDRPYAVIARTIKGKGIPWAEDQLDWHGKVLSREQARQAIDHLSPLAASAELWRPTPPEPLAVVTFPQTGGQAGAMPGAGGARPAYPLGAMVSTRKAAGAALARLGDSDAKIVVLDGDVENSTCTDAFAQRHPERFVECYIAEQNMVAVSNGLSAMGLVPFSATFASFYSRAFDQIRMAGISRANIKMIGTHAGVSIGEDGPSQMGLEDLATMRAVAGSHVLYPCDAVGAERMVELMASRPGIFYLRATRGETPVIYPADERFEIGGAKILRQTGQDALTVITAGITVFEALQARELLAEQGIPFTLIDAYSIKPLARQLILEASRATLNPLLIVTVEDHYPEGGLGDAVAGELSPYGARVHKLAVGDIPGSGRREEQLNRYGIDAEAIMELVSRLAKQARRGEAA